MTSNTSSPNKPNQILAAQQGVLLRSADDHSGNDMCDPHRALPAVVYASPENNPCGGAVMPASLRSRAASTWAIHDGSCRPRPTSTKLPTRFRTMLYRKPSASTSKIDPLQEIPRPPLDRQFVDRPHAADPRRSGASKLLKSCLPSSARSRGPHRLDVQPLRQHTKPASG